ncbi:hypothetical protein CHS0354_001758 [Potamilus streckersoni]|uniref:RNase H type-1 domain-containing protein n=1 Tax=Potamilus streckersoni TaxID=2493646 RepID=A0AAE0VWE0_9BIVA|nr:hypothetical protein CHS0354_001758 [Potamilus streckersoni]
MNWKITGVAWELGDGAFLGNFAKITTTMSNGWTYPGCIRNVWRIPIANYWTRTRQNLLHEVHKHLRDMETKGIIIDFLWVPSQIQLPGNDKADAAARLG